MQEHREENGCRLSSEGGVNFGVPGSPLVLTQALLPRLALLQKIGTVKSGTGVGEALCSICAASTTLWAVHLSTGAAQSGSAGAGQVLQPSSKAAQELCSICAAASGRPSAEQCPEAAGRLPKGQPQIGEEGKAGEGTVL